MRALVDDLRRRLAARGVTVPHLLLRAAVPMLTAVVLLCATLAGDEPLPVPVLVVVLAAGLVAGWWPDSPAPLAVSAALIWAWPQTGAPPLTPWVLPAALALLLLHVVVARETSGPPSVRSDPAARRRWAVRTAVVAVVTILVWLLVRVVDGDAVPGNAVVTAAAVVVLAGLAVLARVITLAPGVRDGDVQDDVVHRR